MDTPAAALIRRTETPAWPNCFRQRKVASTSASRRTSGVARWNFGTCRLVAIRFPFFCGLYRSAAERPRLLRRVVDESRGSLGHVAPDVQARVFHRRVVALVVDT